jgi:plastocyanin
MKTSVVSKSRLITGIGLLTAVFILAVSCTKPYDNPYGMTGNTGVTGVKAVPGTNEVFIQDMTFNPGTITVAANTTIKWTNKDGVAHTVTSTTGLFDSGTISANGTYTFTFAAAGTFPYYCTVHPSMTGTVKVN